MTETMTIQEACAAIDYNPAPGFENKTEKEQWAMIKAKRIERAQRDAKLVLATFATSAAFAKLDAEIQDAITCIAVKRTGGGFGGIKRNPFMETLQDFLGKVGDSVDEMEMFKATKMGRGEIKAKIRENLKKADPENRFWVQLDEESECWVLLAVGEEQPAEWNSNPIDEE